MTKALKAVFTKARLPVIASHRADEIINLNLRRYYDVEAKTSVLVNATQQPFSPITGSLLKVDRKDTFTITAADVAAMPIVGKCDHCGTVHRTEASLAEALAGSNLKFNCPVCHELVAAVSPEEGEEDEGEEGEGGEDMNADGDDSTEDGDDTGLEEGGDDFDFGDDDAGDEEGFNEGDGDTEAEGEDEGEEGDEEDSEVTASVKSPTVARVNMLETLASDALVNQRVDLILAGGANPVYYMMVDYRPMAVMRKELASDGVKAIFNDAVKFKTAFFTAAAEGLTPDVQSDFGVEPVVVEVQPDAVVEQQIEERTSELTEQLNEERSTMEAAFKQSISTAALGVNKGVWKDVVNPLRVGLISELANVSVRNPERIVDRVFEKYGEDYLRAVIAKAYDLAEKSDDSRNEIAQFVEQASYQAVSPSATDDVVARRLSHGNVAAVSNDDQEDEEEPTAVTPMVGDKVQTAGVNNLRNQLKLARR